MIINTNTTKTNNQPLKSFESERWIRAMYPCKRVHFTSAKTVQDRYISPGNLFVSAAHRAFSDHYSFTIAPEVIWLIIQQEVATFVKNNAENPEIAAFFTRDSSKKTELIIDLPFTFGENVDWTPHLEKFRPMLVDNVPSDIMEVMTPSFTTETPTTRLAHLVSFMDCASKYYDFGGRTLCGIPKFNVTGTVEDWEKIENSIGRLSQMLPYMSFYFGNLKTVIKEIKTSLILGYGEPSFWDSFYKVNSQSGGPYISGWINQLYAHVYHSRGTNLKSENTDLSYIGMANFGTNLSFFDFNWNYLGTVINMGLGAGVIGVEMVDGFITPQIGVTVIEKG